MNYIVLYLKRGYALIDECDFDLISKYKWRIDNLGYVVSVTKDSEGRRGIIFMHRLILGLTDKNVVCDHINHHKSDNRRCNIRPATPQQNAQNAKPRGECKYLGVTYQHCSWTNQKTGHTYKYKYIKAKINYGGKLLHIGTFNTEREAALAYNKAASQYFGEFANLNIL